MVANVKDKAVIVGVGNTQFSKNSGVSELHLACRAVKAALDDAGLHPSQVDGIAYRVGCLAGERHLNR